jgi:hypothetical protein
MVLYYFIHWKESIPITGIIGNPFTFFQTLVFSTNQAIMGSVANQLLTKR